MTLPVYERIMALMAERVARCTPANGYEFEVTAVLRRKIGDTPAYLPGTVELTLDTITRITGIDAGLSPWVECQAEIKVSISVPASATGDPVESTCAVAERDVHAAIGVEDRLGLCDLLTLDAINRYEGVPGEVAGMSLTYSANFMMNEYDLTKGRTDG